MSATVKPLEGIKLKENRILIEKFSKEEKVGMIYMPEKEQETPDGGIVVSIGPGRTDPVSGVFIENLCKVGEAVRYMEHGAEQSINGKLYYLLRDSDVWADITK